jgi:hypothetical protein
MVMSFKITLRSEIMAKGLDFNLMLEEAYDNDYEDDKEISPSSSPNSEYAVQNDA